CSQSSIHLGLMAMSCAKHFVLLGDNKQLSAIIGEKVQNVSDNFENISYVEEQYREKEEWNFLSACDRVFRGRIHSSFLNEHYRCHPSIIDFCNRYVYDDRLIVRTARSNGNDFRMRAVWYEGDYYERTDNPNMDAGGAEGRENNNGADCYGNCNIRQIRIFLEEELPRYLAVNEQHLREMNRLHPELEAKNLSVAIISPFRAQLNILKEELNRLQIEAQLEDENPIVNKLPCLTIHKAQGKGYDIVYLMTVADSDDKTGIWAQRMRMINVAVSRAKKEFCIITSSRWLPPETQKELTGYVLPVNSKPEDEKNNLFFCKLLEYVAEKCPEPQEDYGLHKSPLTSIFDKVPLYRLTGAAGKKSAPERCMYEALTENFGDEYTIYSEVPLKCVEQLDNADIDNSRLADYIEKARFDFVLCNGNSVKLIIEVDGSYHRSRNYSSYAPDKSQLDEMKDTIVRDYLVGEDIFMRIPTNGKTDNEIEMIKKKLDMNTTAEITLSAVCSKSTLVSARNDFIYRQYRKFTEKKNSLGEGESLRNYFMDYKNPDNVGYDNEITRAIYHCRYGAAYSFEYSMLFDAILRSFAANNRNGSNLKVYSFGCGSLLEAWSLAYARASLAETNDCYKRIKLSFDGVDCLDWVDKYVPVDDSSADYIQKMLYRQFGGNVNVVIDDIINFAKENFAAGMPFDHNVILFPKVLNHISAVDFNRFLGYLSAASFTEPEYYICISHSRYAVLQGKNDLDKAKRLVGIFKSKGFEVCSDITEITGNSEDFKNNWEGDDSLVKADEKSDPAAYVFHTAIDEGLYDKNSSYIKDINEDFKCPYHVWQTFKELGENEDYKDLHPCCVAHVSQITFQLIRLRRK
ncbi:MAG: AAA domain-containing protein, partial [Ruminiclostridium sp.]